MVRPFLLVVQRHGTLKPRLQEVFGDGLGAAW